MTAAAIPGQPDRAGPAHPGADLAEPVEPEAQLAGLAEPRADLAGLAGPGAEPGAPGDRDTELAELRRQAGRLLAETAGPVRRIHLRSGDTVLEIEWHGSAGTPEPAVPSGRAPIEPAAHDVASGTGEPDRDGRRAVVAPLVGTYYQAAEPGGAPFVEVGDKVEPGQVVCIVEAMKLMNEVVAEQAGRVVEVLVRDGEPVEFGQPLIALLPA